MNKTCIGCGVQLQVTDQNLSGYVKNLQQDYCSSCFRLRHYGDYTSITKEKVDPYQILNKIAELQALNVLVIDLFHLQESSIPALFRWLKDEPVILMVTKRELLPQTMSLHKLKQALMPFMKESHLNIVDVLVTGKYGKLNREENIQRINELKQEFKKDKVVLIGRTNVGKSTLVNALANKETVSVSAMPGTTLDLVLVESEIDNLYDSAGIAFKDGLIEKLALDKVKALQTKKIKPVTYQLKGKQALILDGFGYCVFEHEDSYSITAYFPESISLHRTKMEAVQSQFNRFDQLLPDDKLISYPVKNIEANTDLVIEDLGFISLHQKVKVTMTMKESIVFNTRKALL